MTGERRAGSSAIVWLFLAAFGFVALVVFSVTGYLVYREVQSWSRFKSLAAASPAPSAPAPDDEPPPPPTTTTLPELMAPPPPPRPPSLPAPGSGTARAGTPPRPMPMSSAAATPAPPLAQAPPEAGSSEPAGPAPVRVGNGIREPRKLRHVSPVYPDIARQARVQGVVILELTINPQGRVTDARILRGIPLLDQAALDAVRQWVYTPTLVRGTPVPVLMTVTVNFRLQ